ncbi:MAG TPA: hypothetical protein VN375_16055 [Vicinamibacteria bacterium]|nr:hypothetical protein [Vicinamibacteria bacterium]
MDAFEPECVKQACYELRASTIFYETGSGREDMRVELGAEAVYILRPQSYVTIISMESIELPTNVMGRVLTKGQLFSIGLLPVNTYADPGFSGRLGITVYNASYRHLIIKPGQAIAKIEFSVLPKAVVRPYSGQHGFATGIWPVPTHLFAKPADLSKAGVVPDSESELAMTYGPEVARLMRRFRFYERRVWLQLFLTISAFLGAVALFGRVDWVAALALGIMANLGTHLLFWIGGERRR